MITLAIDSSSETASVALLENQTIRAELFLNAGFHHSVILLPAIQQIYETAGLTVDRTDLFVCTLGPGSFTGLRIGVGTIKGMAMATNKPVAGVSTLKALAANAAGGNTNICPLIDAGRGQIYAAHYKQGVNANLQLIGKERLVDLDLFLRDLEDGNTFFIGSGAVKYADSIKVLSPEYFFAATQYCHVRASIVGLLGLKMFQEGNISDALSLTPRYLRLSDAERNYKTPQ